MPKVEHKDVDPKRAAEHLRDEVLHIIRAELPKPWQTMSEQEQQRCIDRVESVTRAAVVDVCKAISHQGTMAIAGKMGPLGTDKDGNAKVPITFAGNLEDDEKLGIWDHIGTGVTVVLMDPQAYMVYAEKAAPEPDQPELPVDKPKETPQPHWPTVQQAMKAAEAEEEGAGEIIEEDGEPEADLLDDGEEMSAEEVNELIDIPNPTKQKVAK